MQSRPDAIVYTRCWDRHVSMTITAHLLQIAHCGDDALTNALTQGYQACPPLLAMAQRRQDRLLHMLT